MKSGKIGGKRGDSNYVEKDEKLDRKRVKENMNFVKKKGLASAMKKAQKQEGKAKLPKVKPTRKY